MTDLSKMTLQEKVNLRPPKEKSHQVSKFIEPKKHEIMTALKELNIPDNFHPTDDEIQYVASVFNSKKFLTIDDVKPSDIDLIGRRELEDLNKKLKAFTDKMNNVKAFGLFELIDKLSNEVAASDMENIWEKAMKAKPTVYARFMSMFNPSYSKRSISEQIESMSTLLKSKGASLGAKIDLIENDLNKHKQEQINNIDAMRKVYDIYVDAFVSIRKQFALIIFIQHFYKTRYEQFLQIDSKDFIDLKKKEDYNQVYNMIENRAFIIQKSMAQLPLTVTQNASIISSCSKIIEEIDNTILSSMPMIRANIMNIHGVLLAKHGILASESATTLGNNLARLNSKIVTDLSVESIQLSSRNRLNEAKNLHEIIEDFKNRRDLIEEAKRTAAQEMEEAKNLLNQSCSELQQLFNENKI
jgi:hypothetical protein